MLNERFLVRAMPGVFVLIWSTGFIVARLGLPFAPPFKLLSLRYAFSVLCLLAWVAWTRPAWPKDARQWMHLAVTGMLLQAGYLGGVWAAVKLGIGAGTVALIVGLQPVLTAVWVSATASRGASRVSPTQWAGLALGLAGLALVVWRKLGAGEIGTMNLLLSLFALMSITIGTLYQKRYVKPCDFRTALVVQMSAALVVSLPLVLFEPEAMVWHRDLLIALGWSVIGLTVVAGSLLFLLIERGAATAVTSLLYLVPPCTSVMAWLLFDEPITASMLAGMALTAIGVFVVLRGEAPRAIPATGARDAG